MVLDIEEKIIAALVAILLLIGGAYYAYSKGYSKAEAIGVAKLETMVANVEKVSSLEAQRQSQANLTAQREAASQAESLKAAVSEREATIKELQDEASRDPNAGRVCLGVDGVRRLNKVRAGRH